jgi:hypothetical protein
MESISFSGRKARELNSKLQNNVEQWKNFQRVTSRRGVFKNLGCNRTGYTIDRKQPLKQRGCLLVDPKTLNARLGKRRSRLGNTIELGPAPKLQDKYYCLSISDSRLKLQVRNSLRAAYEKNLSFLQGGKKSCKHLKYIAYFICEFGITLRLYRKLSLAAKLVFAGKPNRAFQIIRSVAGRCGNLRHKWAEHAIIEREPSLSDSSQYSDW